MCLERMQVSGSTMQNRKFNLQNHSHIFDEDMQRKKKKSSSKLLIFETFPVGKARSDMVRTKLKKKNFVRFK